LFGLLIWLADYTCWWNLFRSSWSD